MKEGTIVRDQRKTGIKLKKVTNGFLEHVYSHILLNLLILTYMLNLTTARSLMPGTKLHMQFSRSHIYG